MKVEKRMHVFVVLQSILASFTELSS